MGEDERLQRFMEVVKQIPPTWTCMKCQREFDNGPNGEQPELVHYKLEPLPNGDMQQVIDGHICRDCAK